MTISLRKQLVMVCALVAATGLAVFAQAPASPPQVTLSNGELNLVVYLPDAERGFFRGTRFDWAGVIGRLEYRNHVFYQPWFSSMDLSTRDYVATGPEIVAGPNTAVTGPVEEFQRGLGYDDAAPGGPFVKIGVGVLKKPTDGSTYSTYRLYEILDGGKRTVDAKKDSITFTHELREPVTGYGYAYTKTLRLVPGLAEMRLEHTLRNTGTRRIETTVYNHNFLALDKLPVGAGFVVKAPYEIKSTRPPDAAFAQIRGKEVVYLADLTGTQVVSTPLTGFGPTAADYDFRIEHTKAGVGMRIVGDRTMSNATLWSMRATMGLEPFIAIGIDPGQEFTWTLTYTYYQLSAPPAD